MIRNDILQKFPDLFGAKKVNGRDVNVQETITTLTRELRPEIAAALTARRQILESPAPVREKYGWPKWDEKFEDPIKGGTWTYRQIVQGMIDNFLGRETEWRWRLNDEVPVPKDAHPLKNPGLELTGPWHPLDMAFNALNSPAPMNMPDFEDASPTHFLPDGTPSNVPVGVFAALQNAKEIFAGNWTGKPYEVVKKGKTRAYNITKPPAQWPTRFGRPPGLHINYDHVTVDDRPAPATIVVATLWAFNNYDSLKNAGSGVYFYIPKLQTPKEALIVEKILSRLESMIGIPAGSIKIKMLYEEGNAGRTLPGHCVDSAPPPAGHQRGPLGLPGQPDRNVEGRSQRRLSRSAIHRHGLTQHDCLPALQRAHDADGRHEEWRTGKCRAYRRHGRSNDLPGWRSLWPLPL